MLGTKVAGPQPVNTVENPWHVAGWYCRKPLLNRVSLDDQRLVERGSNVAAKRIVTGQRFIGPLQYDGVTLAREGLCHGLLGERPEHVDVDRTDLGAPGLSQVVDRRFTIFSRRAQRNEDGIGVLGFVFRQ